MGKAVLILGPSGSGKSSAMKNMPAATTLVAKCIHKSFPFRAPEGWARHIQPNPNARPIQFGNVIELDGSNMFGHLMWMIDMFEQSATKKVLIIDDFQEMMQLENMMKIQEKGYEKYTQMAVHVWHIIQRVTRLPPDRRVYFLAHTEEIDGVIRMKTVGKMVNEKITPEGYFAFVLRCVKREGRHLFLLRGDDCDPVKIPPDMFGDGKADMENDLAVFDAALADYNDDL